MLLKLGDSETAEIAELYVRWVRNQTERLRKTPGPRQHELLTLLNVTAEEIRDMFEFNTTKSLDEPPCYCGGTWQEVASSYRQYHGYASLMVCVFGTIANLLNIIVLTRKELVTTPINRILTGIAVADMLVMLEYIPFAAYMYLLRPVGAKQFTHGEAVFILCHMHFSQLLHTVSICLTLTLALWRYLAIQFPYKSPSLCSDQRCSLLLGSACALSLLICVPQYLVFSIRATRVLENRQNITLYHVDLSDLAKQDQELLYTVHFWLYAVVVKLLPCAVLTLISYWLISVLWQVNARKQRLRCDVFPTVVSQRTYKPEKRVDRTTKLLVAVLLLFLMTEVPQGVLGLLSGILGHCFFKHCYHQLGEFLDILALLNGAINFILYCSMSRQFRDAFNRMFKPQLLNKCPSGQPHTDVQTTYV